LTSPWIQHNGEFRVGCKVRLVQRRVNDHGWFFNTLLKEGHPNVFTVSSIGEPYNLGVIKLEEVQMRFGHHGYPRSFFEVID
jgi:hypothetical protein